MSRPMEPFYGIVEKVESRGRQDAVSPKGARGVMQLMPDTIKDPGFGVPRFADLVKQGLTEEEANRRVGQSYLDAMHKRYGDVDTALMAYNWGPGNVDKWIKRGRNPNAIPKETRNYLAQITGGNMSQANQAQGQTSRPALQMGEDEEVTVPVLAANPNAPQETRQRPIVTPALIANSLNPQVSAVEGAPALQELSALEENINNFVRSKQEGLVGPQAAAFARENNLALNDPRVLDMAADRNVSPLQKGLSILQGIIGTPFGILGNALGENIDYTSAFRPEQTYKTRAQQALAAFEADGIAAKKEIAELRQDARQSIFTAVQPAVQSAYDTFGDNQLQVGQKIENKMVIDALRNAGYVNEFGEVDTSSPAAQQFIAELTKSMAVAGKTRGPLDDVVAALLPGLTEKFVDKRDENLGKADAEFQSKVLNDATTAASQIGSAETLYAASERLGNVSYGGAAGAVKAEVQASLAAMGIESANFTDRQILDAMVTGQALPRMQQLGGNDSEKELIEIKNSLGGSAAPLESRRVAGLSNIASLKAQVEYGNTFRRYAQRVGRDSANQFDFMDSQEYKEFQRKKLFQHEPRLLPSLFRLNPKRYQNFVFKDGQVYVRGLVKDKAVPITNLTQDQIDKAMGN